MPLETVETLKEKLLSKLRSAGSGGLAKGKLGIRGAGGNCAQALSALIAERKIANLGTATRTCYVLIEHFNPLERACARIEKNARDALATRGGAIELLTQRDLEKGCQGEVRKSAGEALDRLVKQGRLLRFRRGRTLYYVHADTHAGAAHPEAVAAVSLPPPAPVPAAFDRQAVAAAYRRLRQRLGYGNVEIAELRREAGCTLDALKEFLIEESRAGRAVLSLGDASVSNEESRAAAVELFGKPHLLVRLDEA